MSNHHTGEASGDSQSEYALLEHAIIAWASAQGDVRAIVAVGSLARANPGPDQWSDLDLILFATNPDKYSADSDWLRAFGALWLAVRGRTGRGDPEWDALYAGGLKADFVIVAAGDGMQPVARLLESSPYRFVFGRGVRRLLDKNDPLGNVPLPHFAPEPPQKPDAAAFSAHRDRFLLDATRATRFLARGDLWRATRLCDCDLKRQLLTMLEWHALATGDDPSAIWYDGRFLDEWADPAALRDLRATFAAYEPTDLARALTAALDLHSRLAKQTAGAWGYAPAGRDTESVTAWLRDVLRVNPRC